jgi:hypothetical protein
MLRFLDRFELWDTLRKSARATKMRRYVAVAYLGKGGASILPLRKGDVLVCALTEQNARNGSVSPAEIGIFIRRGVRVYVQDDLHAKIFLFGRNSIVGSANLSKSSQNSLDEAALMTTDASVARRLRQWFDERMHSPVTPAWLSHCRKIYRPPIDAVGRGKILRKPMTRGVWLLGGLVPTEYPESEKPTFESGEKTASARLRNSRRYEVDSIRWTGKASFQPGDLVVQIWENGKRKVHPHGRLLNVRRTKTSRNGSAAYLYLEMPKEFKTVPWRQFKEECRRIRLKLGGRIHARQIRNHIQATRILSVVSPEKLGTFRARK